MRKMFLAVALLATSGLSGCATWFLGSAPAADGSIYVVGGRQVFGGTSIPTIWLCPSKPGDGECRRVNVIERGS